MSGRTSRADGLTALLLLVEVPLLVVALLVIHYGGIPFGLSAYQPGWCFDHGLPGREVSGGDDVHLAHTLWPLGISCTYAASTVYFPDWPATFRNYGFLAAVLVAIIVTTVALVKATRRLHASWLVSAVDE